jgi:hypothetical protein
MSAIDDIHDEIQALEIAKILQGAIEQERRTQKLMQIEKEKRRLRHFRTRLSKVFYRLADRISLPPEE